MTGGCSQTRVRVDASLSIHRQSRSSFFQTDLRAPRTQLFRSFSSEAKVNDNLRNIAVIAHVDHGKTTLVDKLIQQCGGKTENERCMDSLDLEKERGITIMAKCTSMMWKDKKLNLVDTPGHADFGGEVERVMSMIDGVLLLVDAAEGPMAQTKFVLGKSLARGLRPIVVINKVDKDSSRVREVENEVFDLFSSLDASEDQLDFPIVYASGRSGWADLVQDGPRQDMSALLDLIVSHVPPPKGDVTAAFSMSVTMLSSDTFLGRLLIGRIHSGVAKVNDPIHALNMAGQKIEQGRITKILYREGEQGILPLESASAGDIIQLAGLSKASISDTICSVEVEKPLETIAIDPPTVCMTFSPNDSPLAGKDGNKLTSQLILERLQKEAENNVSIQVGTLVPGCAGESFEVYGRGELQLGILLENMRREGFELSVSPPQVVFKEENGVKLEPIEEVVIEVDDEFVGSVVNKLTARKGVVCEMKESNEKGRTRIRMNVPTRGLLGYRSIFFTDTRGTGILTRIYLEHQKYLGNIDNMRKGVLVSMATGKTTEYSLKDLEARGTLIVGPRVEVYCGMIFGEHSKETDLDANPTKTKHVSNVRTTDGKDDLVQLKAPRKFNLEECLSYIMEDEVLEVTPNALRMRKKELDPGKRQRASKNKK
ncbi:hypothetical protein GUITHDRAFT_68817 [Guillardia theta CCMP2712]|uniref:Tr-type G domain-containing protein n=1 Tax=Guillardia theta (strain CCMP2712) TaxID=905079 RepID=L1JJZ6_GUITC|nr:hypothetical protein GUITHDRAFT_68817 [Guillardia theta CCMP2712]EKX48415.1 hypothetical protein GUITHDRAFT_68817 [Guillardia theta CCMP2712]|eukprot:XP_005835395.1 hypothetical protein GUITHDRAFT_68817 [Guillardia theta CCMP2712]